MNEDSENLLKECVSGCKMALESIHQAKEFTKDNPMKERLDYYMQKHKDLEEEISKKLLKDGEPVKDPHFLASTFSWFTTEMKLLMKNDSHQIGKLMMDGCNMGIQSVSKYINQYVTADEETRSFAERLISLEEEFMEDMKKFM